MKKIYNINWKSLSAICLVAFTLVTCEREISDDAVEALFSDNADVFIDGFSVGLEYFPFGGSKLDAFTVDNQTVFEGSASMRFDVPNVGDPDGAFAGAIFQDLNGGRNLTKYDALTFYAKATTAGTINEIGFGQDFGDAKYLVTRQNLRLTTNWKKYIIPIPDASKLTQESGLLWYAEGPEDGDGYTFWLDTVQFESLGTVAQPRPRIFNGEDVVQQTFVGSSPAITGLTQTLNTANGEDITVIAAPAYFTFSSSDSSVAVIDETGNVNVIGSGTTVITASLNGVDAAGSLTLESLGDFEQAPTPDRDQANVISVFSDAYNNVPVDYYNGFFNGDGQTTLGGAPPINIGGQQVINYTNLNFVGIGTFMDVSPINASQMTHIHVDINVQEEIQPGDQLTLQLLNGVQTANEISGRRVISGTNLRSNEWVGFDIPLGEFAGLSRRDAIGLMFFISNNSANVPTISNIFVDNIYYYKEVVEPSPNVNDVAATQVALPVGFESPTLDYGLTGFEGAVPAVVANPMPTGINPTANVGESLKSNGAAFFAGNVLELDAPITFSGSRKFRMKVLSPKSGIPIRVQLEDAGNTAGARKFLDANTTTSGEWEELEWDFTALNPGNNLVRIVIFFEFIDGRPGDGSTYYFDDIKILN
ncbi:carbohydrate-binding protein [Nonlabens sp. Hel1_33_55]|uniref:carbohydrate-binding protein n=1 Tax=Nonlabens sp. Hel1_33_55 TaxID=1336802 RepID=UPI0018D290BE|nr:carbohydrate-binding protein [Nonlabens sp. Hel1_33_55]